MRYSRQAVGCFVFLCVSAIISADGGAAFGEASPSPAAQDTEDIDPRDLQVLAILYIENNQPHEAIPLLERSVDLYPENGETYMWLGVAQTFTEQYQAAEESLMKALARNPSLTEARNYLGFLRYKQGDLNAAVREYRVALEDPVYPPISKARVHYNLGNVYLELGNPDAAREQLSTASGMLGPTDPLFAPLHLQLAKALKELDRVQEAISALQKIVDADAGNVDAHLELGLAYRDLSQASAARRHLEKVIELAPGTEASASARAALARLQ